LLLVEDDAVSAAFLAEALAGLPAEVDVAANIAEARALALRSRHDLWLVDAHLPDGDGLECLQALRELATTPALALTAGAPREQLDALCAGGYLEVLPKPVSVALLQGTARRLLGIAPAPGMAPVAAGATCGKLPIWEDAAALAAIGGNPESLAKLRRLFLGELPAMQAQLATAQQAGDAGAVGALVHKLRASCGFVGAARLRATVESLALVPLDARARLDCEFAAHDALSTPP
jgi:CheY-like chemotaxis protein